MQQRQLRLGDILDDYCPRERRVTNHAVVAMIGSEVKQTRCTTCDAEHDYKAGKVPSLRKKKEAPAALYDQVLAEAGKNHPASSAPVAKVAAPSAAGRSSGSDGMTEPASPPVETAAALPAEPTNRESGAEEGPVHRPLIRATLPRTDATMPTRQIPEFTIRQNSGRPGKFRAGAPHRQRPMGGGAGHSGGGPRHAGRPGIQGGRGGSGPSSPSHHGSSQHPHGTRMSRPGKKRSR